MNSRLDRPLPQLLNSSTLLWYTNCNFTTLPPRKMDKAGWMPVESSQVFASCGQRTGHEGHIALVIACKECQRCR